jgi:predicted amidophosphoribosyltransferase
MELHRTEIVRSDTGVLVPVQIFGVEPHEGHIRELVLGLKYGKKRKNARELAEIVVDAIVWRNYACDVVTWAPTTSRHQQERGMDHAELIARHVGVLLMLPTKRLLRRVNGVSQTGLDRDERLMSPEFVARPLGRQRNVMIIDDVVTTGATFRAASRAIVDVGALSIICIAPSRTV